MILLLCLIVVAAALSIIALALYEGTASPPGTPVAAMAAERVAAEPVQWQVAPETAGDAGEDSDSREADDGEAGGYVMASFKQGKAMGDGLRLLHSQDALRWEALPPSGKPVLAWTEVEGASVFRDPSMVWDRGLFHLVFTAELGAAPCGAPSGHEGDETAWSPPLPLELPPEDAGRSVIDLFLLLGAAGAPHALFYKLEDNRCERRDYELGALLRGQNCTLAIRHATARRVTGPWAAATASGPFFLDAISRPCCEGPAAGFGALEGDGASRWRDISGSVEAPAGYKHGTALLLPHAALRAVCEPQPTAAAAVGASRRETGRFRDTELCKRWRSRRNLEGERCEGKACEDWAGSRRARDLV
ncbi:hypothetical protein EMIHUDRAFT_454738 [Emiliania huxleyi CCMP1516]|uniref:Glycosyl hydrolase family 32 N-terminal domain-containing protein n=2 Tax=Emiliania huxleyi TaxID=2903 RepID=A0A0D3KQ65_EMIH1|nr:hypothetical protein EMIHUDRAFT_454738 [Emiliania huxleyi CCMP1516]EOD37900.1 hypothetical protein EMIHUDRAFT_454738 [Emiliania huxleyi CCMP1516]|eukprot:XP_005790329.1 hypothetical protein EMIHUDRAFT_454738 [Emiliania huxleyi CCMP1516]